MSGYVWRVRRKTGVVKKRCPDVSRNAQRRRVASSLECVLQAGGPLHLFGQVLHAIHRLPSAIPESFPPTSVCKQSGSVAGNSSKANFPLSCSEPHVPNDATLLSRSKSDHSMHTDVYTHQGVSIDSWRATEQCYDRVPTGEKMQVSAARDGDLPLFPNFHLLRRMPYSRHLQFGIPNKISISHVSLSC